MGAVRRLLLTLGLSATVVSSIVMAGLIVRAGLSAAATRPGAGAGSTPNAGASATVTIPTGGASAPAVTVTTPVAEQDAAAIAAATRRAGTTRARVSIGARADSQSMPAGFIGFSLEYGTIERYAAVGRLFDQAVENLAPGQRPVIRIGGTSADHASVPIAGFGSRGVWETLGPSWLAAAKRMAVGLNARLVPDLDMEVNQPRVPAAEVRTMLARIGARYIPAFELGNEPGLYSQFAWYKVNHRPFLSRSPTWDPADYVSQITATVGRLRGVELWGPALSAGSNWWSSLPELAGAIPHLTTITGHAYPTSCLTTATSSQRPSVANLLAPSASVGLVARFAPELAFATRTRRSVRIDEINTTNCAGRTAIPSFASALWAIEAGFAMDRAGVSGLNLEMYPGAADRPFSFSVHNRSVSMADEYYGWMLFARAAPVGSRQLTTATTGNPSVEAFASRTSAGTNVVLINDSAVRSATVTLTAPRTRRSVVEALDSPGLFSVGHVTLAGMSISPSSGELTGTPRITALGGTGRFSVVMRPGSADLIQLSR